MSTLVDRAHDQKNISKDRWSIDAEWDRRHVGAACLSRQLSRLPRIEQVANHNGNRNAGQHVARYELDRQTATRRQANNQQKVGKTGKEQAEKSVQVS